MCEHVSRICFVLEVLIIVALTKWTSIEWSALSVCLCVCVCVYVCMYVFFFAIERARELMLGTIVGFGSQTKFID